jgi:predicted nucleic-acid-binding protein
LVSLDTNVLIRFIVQDDAAQFRLASGLITQSKASGQRAVVTILVVLECEWVLRSSYQYSKIQILSVLNALIHNGDVSIEDYPVLERALDLWERSSVQFANCFILAKSLALGCSTMVTFDKRASELVNCSLLT